MSIAEKLIAMAEDQQKVYDAGVSAGQTAEYDRFWDAYQQNGERTNYYQAFLQIGWDDTNFNPKYPIVCKGGSTNAMNVFSRTRATRICVPVTIEGIAADSTFYYATNLKTISKLVLNGVTGFSTCFVGCSKLENITIEGSIDASFNISASSVLTKESIKSIMYHLGDNGVGKTLTLSKTAVDNAFAGGYDGDDSTIGSETIEWDDVCQGAWMHDWTVTLV